MKKWSLFMGGEVQLLPTSNNKNTQHLTPWQVSRTAEQRVENDEEVTDSVLIP